MNIVSPRPVPVELTALFTLARLLERLDHSPTPVDAEQYRHVARRLADALTAAPEGLPLQALLDTSPSAAALYENLHYDHAGLCRAPLDASMASEIRARDAIAAARRRASAAPQR